MVLDSITEWRRPERGAARRYFAPQATASPCLNLHNLKKCHRIRICHRAGKVALYAKLVRRLVSAGMVKLQKHAPLVINGLFAVPKGDDQQRLIVDCRRANYAMAEPPAVNLPSSASLVRLQKAVRWAAKANLSNYLPLAAQSSMVYSIIWFACAARAFGDGRSY